MTMRGPVMIVHYHFTSLAILLLLLLVAESYGDSHGDIERLVAGSGRKLLSDDCGDEGGSGDGDGGGDTGGGGGDMGRMDGGCSKDDIIIYQGPTGPLPDGIPSFTVQIINECGSECSISDIHVSCGWFSSARQIDPTVFRRIDYDDCLVNDGNPLGPGQMVEFMYANTYPNPLSVSSVSC